MSGSPTAGTVPLSKTPLASRRTAPCAQGAIVKVSSVASVLGTGSSVAYAASKAALETMSFSLARTLAPEVRVNVVAPGHTRTPWHEQARGAAGAAEVEKRYSSIAPLKSIAEAEDVADAIVRQRSILGIGVGADEDLVEDAVVPPTAGCRGGM